MFHYWEKVILFLATGVSLGVSLGFVNVVWNLVSQRPQERALCWLDLHATYSYRIVRAYKNL